jgi:peptidoglycan/LPS O-acetylase OafA/YrhL
MMRDQKAGKLVPLEGLRGIAAVIVMLGHMVRGLVPPHHGKLDALKQVHHWLLNGGAAVTVFFVLSGFILSLPFAKDRSPLRVATALLKRWPRLAALTTIACLFSWVVIVLSQDYYEQAAAVTGNTWMASHFNAPLHGHEISWVEALRDGLYRVFLFGEVKFDSPLWTMRIELFGSFAIFLAAPVLFRLKHWPLRLAAIGTAMVAVGTSFPMTYFSDFLVGTTLAMLFAEDKMPEIPNWLAAGLATAGLYLFCFSAAEDRAMYAPLKSVMTTGETAHFVWDASAVLIIVLLLGNPFARHLFSKDWAVWLGLLSFPLYLLHVPIMLSAGAVSFMGTVSALGETGAVLVAGAVTIALTLILALPLAWVDKAWTGVLGRATGRLLKRRPAVVLATADGLSPRAPRQ